MKVEQYLNEGKLPFSKKDIEKGLNFLEQINKYSMNLNITDWDGRGNYEIELPGEGKKWYSKRDAINKLFFYIQ